MTKKIVPARIIELNKQQKQPEQETPEEKPISTELGEEPEFGITTFPLKETESKQIIEDIHSIIHVFESTQNCKIYDKRANRYLEDILETLVEYSIINRF